MESEVVLEAVAEVGEEEAAELRAPAPGPQEQQGAFRLAREWPSRAPGPEPR